MHEWSVRQPSGRLRRLTAAPKELKIGLQVVYEGPDGLWTGRAERLPVAVNEHRKGLETVKFVRLVGPNDERRLQAKLIREQRAYLYCREHILSLGLNMHLTTALFSLDEQRLILPYTAPGRIDFRELLKRLNKQFPGIKILLRQLSARQEAGALGGIGPCGRELCCSSFLNSFENITLQVASDQDIQPNPGRLAGNCGRLKCCLKYEQDYYLFVKEHMPATGKRVRTAEFSGRVTRQLVLSNSVEVLVGKKLQVVPLADLLPDECAPPA
jgi:cell fate regulator YaaT (PSP1 superfamily)